MRVERQEEVNPVQSAFEEARHNASETLAACVRELEVFAGGSAKGMSDTFQKRLHDNPMGLASETALMGAAGLGLGVLTKNHRLLAYGLTTLGAGTFLATEGKNLPYKQFGNAWSKAWNHSDAHSLKQATDEVARGFDGPMFDLALGTVIGGASAAGGPRALRYFTIKPGDYVRPYYGAKPSLPGSIAKEALDPRLNYVDSGKGWSIAVRQEALALKPSSQITLEAVRKPTIEPLGMGHYTRTSLETQIMRTPPSPKLSTFMEDPINPLLRKH
ncbi:MAG TPA: hypothetical protein V6D17_16160 [Candidatus Obscuribacterales bacterium]